MYHFNISINSYIYIYVCVCVCMCVCMCIYSLSDLLYTSFMKVIGRESIQLKNGADGRLFHSTLKKAFTFEAMSRYSAVMHKVYYMMCFDSYIFIKYILKIFQIFQKYT